MWYLRYISGGEEHAGTVYFCSDTRGYILGDCLDVQPARGHLFLTIVLSCWI